MENTPLSFPFTYEEFEDKELEVMAMSSHIQEESDEVDKFFKTLMSIIGVPNTGLNEDQDFMIKNVGDKDLLYLRFTLCYGKYAARAKQEGVNPMDSPGLIRYLKTHKSFIEDTRSVRMAGKKTSALIFNYSELKSMDIDLQKNKGISEQEQVLFDQIKENEFERLIKDLKTKILYPSKILIQKLSDKIGDHITHAEFVDMCTIYNDQKNSVTIQKNDEEAIQIYTERRDGVQNNINN